MIKKSKTKVTQKFIKAASLFFLGVGVFVLMQVLSPLISFKVWEISAYHQNQVLANPLPSELVDASVLGVSIKNVDNFPVIYRDNLTYKPPYDFFKLSVPKLKLEDIEVRVNSNEFEENLAQLPGTALPGEVGNVFISGHSSLSNTFQSKNRRAFFVNLPKLKKGDEVIVEVVGQKYTYIVEGMKIVEPEDVYVINPPDQVGRYISLMTCVPPGFNTKRLVVLARLK